MKNNSQPLALALFSKSVMKQAKLRAIASLLPDTKGLSCLDIGGDNGVISYFLRRRGGTWTSADLTEEAVSSIRELAGGNCIILGGGPTPFEDKSFDVVVIIDFLEHIPADRQFVMEMARILKPGGCLVVNVPHRKRWSIIRPLRLMIGLSDEKHGHLRPGYSHRELQNLLEPEFAVIQSLTYSRFFSEFMDALLSFAYGVLGAGRKKKSAKGVIVTGRDAKRGGMLKIFSAVYPVFRFFALWDRLLFFTQGYCLIVKARLVKAPNRGDRQAQS